MTIAHRFIVVAVVFSSSVAASSLVGCYSGVPPADLVLTNGKVVTVDSAGPEAQAIAIRADTIAAVGTVEKIDRLIGPQTHVIDLEGRLAIPGFIEGHAHFMSLGRSKLILDLTKTRSWDEIVDMVEEAVEGAQPGEWITGRGWHQEKWASVPDGAVDGVPTHHSLSKVSPENPVYLRHASGHASFVNAAAMRRSAISAETPNPPGGEIIRDVRGRPTGHLRENAQRAVSRAIRADLSRRTDEEIVAEKYRQAELASRESLEKGITSFHDAGVSFETVDFFRTLVDEDRLPLRLYVMVRENPASLKERLADYWMLDYGGMLTVRSVKQVIDGALGSHGAWLIEPYEDLPSTSGLNTTPIDSIRLAAVIALANGFQLNTHAIGDRGNRVMLDIYEESFDRDRDTDRDRHTDRDTDTDTDTDRRWRIEHAQHLHPDDIVRFGELGVIASMQAVHQTSDASWVPKRIGEKRSREGAYMWQSLWQSGAVVTNGTDAPVEDVDPIPSFYASVSRRSNDGTVFYPDERLSREQALQAYTINNAYAAFQEDRLGSISVGKWADITVLSRDIMTIPEDEILDTRVLYTIVGGKIAYQAKPHE